MIIFRKTNDTIRNPGEVRRFTDEAKILLKEEEERQELRFVIPNRFTENSEKTIYKVGFLSSFLKETYPLKDNQKICDILTLRYDVFMGRRQIERHVKAYNSNENYIN